MVADATEPPFRGGRFELVCGYNLIDNVADPVLLLRQLNGILRPGGRLVLMAPYDWSARCTPPPNRLGEGLRLDPQAPPDPAVALRDLLEGRFGQAPELSLRIEHERDPLPWILRRHDRSLHVFLAHYLEAIKPGGADAPAQSVQTSIEAGPKDR